MCSFEKMRSVQRVLKTPQSHGLGFVIISPSVLLHMQLNLIIFMSVLLTDMTDPSIKQDSSTSFVRGFSSGVFHLAISAPYLL